MYPRTRYARRDGAAIAYGTVVGSGLRWQDRGMQVLKGVPGHWPLFALEREAA